MKLLIVALLLAATPAHAAPVLNFVGFLFTGGGLGAIVSIGGFAAGSFGFSAIMFGLRLATVAAVSAVQARLNRPAQPTPQDRMVNNAQAAAPMQRVYGKVRKGGPMGFTKFKAATRYKVVLVAAHSTKGPVQHYFDASPVTLDVSGNVTTAPFTGYGKVRSYTGKASQTADAALVALGAEITSAYDFKGLSYMVLEAKRAPQATYNSIYPSGREWELAPVWEGHDEVYDPRDGLYKYTDNAALIIANEILHFGKLVDWAEVAVEAAICDELVTNGDGGLQKRWTINTILDDTMPWETVRDSLGFACGAWFYDRPDGKVGFKVGRWIEPDITLGMRDFVSLRVSEKAWGPDVAGEFSVRYVEPSRAYHEQASGAYVVQAGAARRTEDSFQIDSHNQASRVAKLMAAEMRPDCSVSAVVKLIGYDLIGQRFVSIAHPLLRAEIVIEITKLTLNEDGATFLLEGRSAKASDYAFDAATEEPARPLAEPVDNEDTIPAVVGLIGRIVTASGVPQAQWTWPAQTDMTQEVRVRSLDGGIPDWQITATGSGQTSLTTSGLVSGATYEAQVRNKTASGKVSDWSVSETVVATASTTGPAALSAFTATGGGGTATVNFTAPSTASYRKTRIYRANTGQTFAQALMVRSEFGTAGAADSWVDSGLAAGGYQYWAEPCNGSGIAGALSGPVSVTVT